MVEGRPAEWSGLTQEFSHPGLEDAIQDRADRTFLN